jgi:O-succinylbenzoic acid--CoA ligase
MDHSNFAEYCANFLDEPKKGAKIFFQNQDQAFSYKNLIEAARNRACFFENSAENLFALQIESPFILFTYLIGAILAQKEVVILSAKEPDASVRNFQKIVPFTKIITDQHSELRFKNNAFPVINNNINNNAAFYVMSSGSSGPSKAIPLSLENIFYSATSAINFFQMKPTDVSFSNLPHHHIGGLMIFWRAFFSAGKITTRSNDNFQFISLVPLQLQRFLDDPEKIKKLQHCHGVLIGGAPLNENLKVKAINSNIPIYETYGMTETCSFVLLNGIPLEGQEIKLDSRGYFLIKGNTLSKGMPVDNEGFYHTNDIGLKNIDGTFTFKHRGDLLFKSAGELINPLELEAHALELPWISEVLVVPIKHHEWTNAAVMIYKTRDGLKNCNDLKDYFKKKVHPHIIPKYFFEASNNLFSEGIKPRRFEIALFAQIEYFKSLFYYHYIPKKDSRKLVVFLHGFTEDHTDMIQLMDNSDEASFLFIDLPGHGRTSTSNFKNRTSVFAELMSLINFYKDKQSLVLYGYSQGGRVAIELTLLGLSPTELILESAHLGLISNEEKAIRKKSDLKLFSDSNIKLSTFFENWYKNPIFGQYNKSTQYISDVQKKIYHNPNEWHSSLEFFSSGAFPFERSEVIKILNRQKITGIVGSEDKKYLEHYTEIKSLLPLMNLNIILNCGHNPHKTHLNEIKQILKKII